MPRVLSPRGAWQYTGSVLVLIGARCASSNEGFIAAMRQLPHVTLVGDRTAGRVRKSRDVFRWRPAGRTPFPAGSNTPPMTR